MQKSFNNFHHTVLCRIVSQSEIESSTHDKVDSQGEVATRHKRRSRFVKTVFMDDSGGTPNFLSASAVLRPRPGHVELTSNETIC